MADKKPESFFRVSVTHEMMQKADEKYRELTEHGEKCLTVFREIPYQMVDMGDSFYFVEMPGYISNDPNALDPAAVYNFNALAQRKPLFRRQFAIAKSDIVSAEIGGRYSGYFNRLCGYLLLTYRQGKRVKKQYFYLPGVNNQFAVRDFLSGIEVTVNPTEEMPRGGKRRFLDRNEESTIGALLKYFNKKGSAINIGNGLLSIFSLALILVNVVLDLPYRDVMRGVAALLPLVIYLRFLRYRHLLSLLVTGFRRKSPYHKLKPECFGKIAVPTVALLMTEVLEFGMLVSVKRYMFMGFTLGFVLTLLYDFFVQQRKKAQIGLGIVCAAMCFFYAFMAILPVNRLWVRQTDSRVMDYPVSRATEEVSQGETFHYCDVHMAEGNYRFYISDEDYGRLAAHELSARADKYSGLLGISYYEFELVQASEEAKRHSAFLESFPSVPKLGEHATAEDWEKYRRQSQELLEKLTELAEKNGLLVSDTDKASDNNY